MNLNNEIKQLIIDCLDLEDVSIDDIETDAPLFGEGLGLDSIDALELGLAIKKNLMSKSKPIRMPLRPISTVLPA